MKPKFHSSISNRSILLIDDDEDDCFLFHKAVTKISLDIKFSYTNSADDLLAILANSKPSIIFIDLHLPKYNGIECLRKIRDIPYLKHVPVIFWSGTSTEKSIQSIYEEGARYYFEKPCSVSDLVVELDRILCSNEIKDDTLDKAVDRKLFFSQQVCYS